MGWQDVQDAMQAGYARAARLTPDRVVWAWQDIDEPATPYVKLAMPSIQQLGLDFVDQDYDPTRPAGQEFRIRAQGQREVAVEVQVFTDQVADGSAAIFLAEQIKTSLLLPSIRRIFTAVGASPFDPGPVNFAPAVVAAGFRGRAQMTVRTYCPAQALAEYVGYIETNTGTITTTGGARADTPALPYSAKVSGT